MNVVADTNLFLAVALEEPEKVHIIEVTTGCDLFSPEILPYEIGNALTALIKRRKISKEQALALYQVTQQIPVKLLSVDIPKALAIATRFNLYAYDAYFLQCAQALSCALMTLDGKLKEVAKALTIEVVE
jgi:predicted nucleic acid-binding protein